MKPNQILKSHLLFVGIMILNWVANIFFKIGLVNWFNNTILILLLLTGMWLFFDKLKPFQKIAIYFSIYPNLIIFGMIGFIFKGILGLLILSLILYPFDLNMTKYHKDEISIYSEAKGFMSACCTYKVVERKFLIFEKLLGRIQNHGNINFQQSEIKRLPKGIEVVFQMEEYEEKTDSFILVTKKIRLEN